MLESGSSTKWDAAFAVGKKSDKGTYIALGALKKGGRARIKQYSTAWGLYCTSICGIYSV